MVHEKVCSGDERSGGQADAQVEARTVDSVSLFDGARTVEIRHGAELYKLRITRADKLILTK